MSNAHCVVVNYICKVVCRVAVSLDKNLILKFAVVNGNFTENCVCRCCTALNRHFLANYIRCTLGKKSVDFFLRKITAMSVITTANAVL